jgi:hypothetical protein
MSRLRYLAEIKQLEQQLSNAINEMNRDYPDEPYGVTKAVQKDLIQLEKDTAELFPMKIRPILLFNISINNKNFNFMTPISNLTLTSLSPQTFTMTVGDANNNNAQIAGVLSALSYVPSDPSQDVAVVDPGNALEVDIHAVALQGGTTVTGTGTFVSTALQPDNITPVFTGTVTGTLVLVNNIVVAVLKPVLLFNQ